MTRERTETQLAGLKAGRLHHSATAPTFTYIYIHIYIINVYNVSDGSGVVVQSRASRRVRKARRSSRPPSGDAAGADPAAAATLAAVTGAVVDFMAEVEARIWMM